MQKFKYDMLYEITPPTIVLATRYHKKLGVIENVSPDITSRFTMSSHQEISFNVYKEKDGVECSLWDKIVDFKYIYVPEHDEYYEIQVDVDESNETIKHCTGKSAGECELSQRYLRDFHCNDEIDILMDDYVVTTLYNASNPKGSLLDRVLHDKCPDWAVRHVDESIANIQRTFTADGTTIYDFFVNTVATEIGCLFKFDSVNRMIDVYDLWNTCNKCGNRSDFNLSCPKCGSTDITRGYGKWANVFISTENFASEITVDGDADSVKNCFKVSGGDDIITAAFMNLNPNGSAYIYRFSQDSISDMPEELQQRLINYNNLYDSYLPSYQKLVAEYYEAVTEELRLHTTMMPEAEIPKDTTAKEQLDILMAEDFTVAVQKPIAHTSTSSADLSVKGYAKAIVDPRYTVDVSSTTLSDLDTTTNTRTWTGILTVKSLGGVNDKGEEDVAKSETLKTVIVNDNYEEFLKQKIDKTLDRSDASFITLLSMPIPKDSDDKYVRGQDFEFKEALHAYSLDRLQSFSNSYESILEVLVKQSVADESENEQYRKEHQSPYGTPIYEEVYLPYYDRKSYVDAELAIREKQVNDANALIQDLVFRMKSIKDLLNLRAYLGEDMYRIFILYLREDTYTNSNYISTGLNDSEVIQKAKELLEVAEKEIQKASELQYTLSGNLINLLNTEEFADFKDEFEIGDWIVCKAADKTFRLRLIEVEYTYFNKAEINVTFSNATRINDMVSDVADILSRASSMATTYDYVAHQASQGEEAKGFVDAAKSDGIEAKDIQILAGDNKDIVVDDHGILARYYDDATGEYSPKQLRITSNIITFTKDAWETTSAALGEQTYQKYDPKIDAYVQTTEYGLSADFVIAGYIEGSTIVSGNIYSRNYSDYDKRGTYIDLERGYFSFAGGDFKYNQNGLSYHGEIITRALNLDDQTDISISHNNMDIVSTNVTEGGIDVTSESIEAYQVGFSNGYGLFVPYHGLFTGEVEANNFYAHEDVYAGGNIVGHTIASQTFVKADENLYVGHTDNENNNEYVVHLESNAGSIEMFSEPTNADLKGMRVTNAVGEGVNVFTVNQNNEVTFNGVIGENDIVLSGTTTPDDSVGRENSVYLKYDYYPAFLDAEHYTHTSIELNTFEEVGDNVYDFSFYGYPTNQTDVISLIMDNLTPGDEYTINFTLQFSNTEFRWLSYHSYVVATGTDVISDTTIFERDNNAHEYSLTFTAGTNTQLDWYFSDVNDGVRFDVAITGLTFTDNTTTIRSDINTIYGKINNKWLEYKPSGGGGDASYRELTQAEYDELTEEEKHNGTIYFITDGEGGGGSARSLAGLDWANKVTVTTSVIAPQSSITYTPPKGGVLIVSGYGNDNMQLVISSSSTEDFYAPLINQSYTSTEFIVNGNEELTISNGTSHVTIGDLAIYFVPFLGGSGSNLVHYSTDEHIVGTDIDGETIYEQTFTPDTLPALSDTGQNRHINTGLTGVSEIWVESNSLCSGNMPFPYVHYDTSNIVGYWWDINSGNPILEVRAGSSAASITITKLTVRYKKSIV